MFGKNLLFLALLDLNSSHGLLALVSQVSYLKLLGYSPDRRVNDAFEYNYAS